jgi:hypothetical protein
MTPYAEVAVAFASALVDGDFCRAATLLTPDLRRQLSPSTLRQKLYGMFRGYASGEPREIHFDEQFQSEAWPAKCSGDVGWAYVGIEGDDFIEAVCVTVADVEGKLLIREVEWGRP